jgi:hypothetical protein
MMSLAGFQRAFCTLIATPGLCSDLRRDPDLVPAGWDLTPRERRRILALAAHRGMATTCSLYRANRLTPLWTLLPRTCFLLGGGLRSEIDLYLARERDADLQFASEVQCFAAHLRGRLASGALACPYLREVLELEVARQELPLLAGTEAGRALFVLIPHPLVRALAFDHEPSALLARLAERRPPPYDELPSGEFWLLIDARDGELRTLPLPARLGRALSALQRRQSLTAGAAGDPGGAGEPGNVGEAGDLGDTADVCEASDIAALLDLGLAVCPALGPSLPDGLQKGGPSPRPRAWAGNSRLRP